MADEPPSLEARKEAHLRLCLGEDVEVQRIAHGFARYHFMHQPVPEIDRSEVDLRLTLFGKPLAAPLLISPMTGGCGLARTINRNLAIAAQTLGLSMGVGSQRTAIEHPEMVPTYEVRDVAPDILLFANLGAVQLNTGYGVGECRRAVEMIGADAITLHLNPLQESRQLKGDQRFRALVPRIAAVCRDLGVPVVVKEVGNGFSPAAADRLRDAGVAAVDVAGAGGTAWSYIEDRLRGVPAEVARGDPFLEWGVPTAEALALVRRAAPDLPVFASGGIRDGLTVAKALAMGATLAGMALPLLGPAVESAQAVIERLCVVLEEVRTALFLVGAPSLEALRQVPLYAAEDWEMPLWPRP